jgi:hypothetical protein
VGADTDLDRVLELVVKRGRALINARSVLVLLVDGEELVVAAAAGQASSAYRSRARSAARSWSHGTRYGSTTSTARRASTAVPSAS